VPLPLPLPCAASQPLALGSHLVLAHQPSHPFRPPNRRSSLQGQLRQREGQMDRLRAALTRAEAKYRASLNACSPGGALGD
jgi:hypothetical protein